MPEKALVLVKPDGVKRALIGRVITKFEEAGLKVVAIKMLKPTAELTGEHYAADDAWLKSVGEKNIKSNIEKGIKVKETAMEIGNRVRKLLMSSISDEPIVAIVIEGNAANEVARKLAGATEPRKADASSIRGAFGCDSYESADLGTRPLRNVVHVSESKEAAEREIKIWFKKNEILDYKRADQAILY
jgi:nucleoside-diphosphate kinase